MPFRQLLRQSRALTIACAVVFAAMSVASLAWPKTEKLERAIAKKRAEHKVVPVELYVPVWLKRGCMINAGLAGFLLLASPWLGRRLSRRYETPRTFVFEGWTWKTWSLAAGVCAFGLWNTVPRLTHSMWGDEEFNASRFIVDEVSRDSSGAVSIEPRPWMMTLWSFRKTTNHLGFTAVARLCHDTFFHRGTGPTDPWFSEALIRLPVFIAGWCSLLALLWAARVWHLGPGCGAAFLVMHAWFTRFAVDGRAYGLVLLCVPLLLGLLGMGLHTGRWRWWLLFGVTGFYMFWAYFGSVYLLVTMNIAALGLLFGDAEKKADRWVIASRWLVGNMLAAMLVIGLMAPCWPQLFEFLEKAPLAAPMDAAWLKDVLAYVLTGTPWLTWDAANPLCFALDQLKSPWVGLMFAILAVHVLAGLGRLVLHARLRWLLLVFLGAPTLMILHLWKQGIKPYEWYFVPYLPGLMLVIDASFFSSRRIGRQGLIHYLRGVPLAAVLMFGTRQHQLYRDHPIEASRESVASYRTVTNPRNPAIDDGVMSGGFVMFTEGYDPAEHRFKDLAGLHSLMAEADSTHRALYVNVGHIEFARQFGFADICAVIEDPQRFEHTRTFHGLLPSTTRDVFRYRGAAAVP